MSAGRVDPMHLDSMLSTLYVQYEGVVFDVQQKQTEVKVLLEAVDKLKTAINSLEALRDGPTPESSDASRNPQLFSREHIVPRSAIDSFIGSSSGQSIEDNNLPPPELKPYVPAGGKRLKSKRMLYDLLALLDEQVSREQLKELFFAHYGRANLEKYWVRPDNALNTAIDRAVADGLIEELPGPTASSPRYVRGWGHSETGEPAFPDNEEDD